VRQQRVRRVGALWEVGCRQEAAGEEEEQQQEQELPCFRLSLKARNRLS
jgi:hypothetical protein